MLDDKDFRCPITRAEFEELCDDLYERVTEPIQEALKSSQMDLVSSYTFFIFSNNWIKIFCFTYKSEKNLEREE